MSTDDRFGNIEDVNPYSASSETTAGAGGMLGLPDGQPRGLVGHVPILGVLMIVQGVLNGLFGFGAAFYAVFIPQIMTQVQQQQQQGADVPPMPEDFAFYAYLIGGTIAVLMLSIGVSTVVAGVRLMRFKGRGFGIGTLCFGMLSLFSCYCFPTYLALAIYGLIVLLNPSVKLAFELGKGGHSAKQIQQAFIMLP
jgi:hypothetical protein